MEKMVHYRLELLLTSGPSTMFYMNIPSRSNDNAGFDMYVTSETNSIVSPTLVDLGCKARMVRCDENGSEEEVHYWLAPRSSIWKNNIMFANSMGVIDRSYRGVIKACVMPILLSIPSPLSVNLTVGTRICQILAPDMGWIKEVRIVDSLPETSRGEGGFGSTGI